MIYFTSDTHFNHTNIIRLSNRPFQSIHEMNEKLIENWNNTVKSTDTIYHLGDFGFGAKELIANILSRLQGKIHLILGNHEKPIRRTSLHKFENKELLHQYKHFYNVQVIEVPDGDKTQTIVLSHFPFASWFKIQYESWHLHGHCHGSLKSLISMRRLDVGVDVHNYTPISYMQVKEIMSKKTFRHVDHHGANSYDTPDMD